MIKIKNKITRTRNVVQLLWFIFFANGVLFGLPLFGSNESLKYVFVPNLTSKYLNNSPTHCFFYELQAFTQSGFSSYYLNLIIPLLILFILLMILARAWCGWLCPVGFVQDLMMHLRRLFKLPYKELNFTTVKVLDRTKFGVLFIAIVLAFLVSIPYSYGLSVYSGNLANPYEQFGPARPMFVIFQQLLGLEPWSTAVPTLGLVVLVIFFIMSFAVRKFWCRICPMGAINSFFNKHALLTLQKDGSKCTKCRICLRACPMDIEEIYEEKGKTNISSKECVHCYRCVELCPEEDCLSVAFFGKTIARSKSPYNTKKGKELKSENKGLFKINNRVIGQQSGGIEK